MRVNPFTRFAAIAVLTGALACASNTARTDDETAAARDTTSDTLGGQAQNPPGYRGMERDTTISPTGQQPSDTFLQRQGVGAPQDTSGYSGAERVDTTGQANPQSNQQGQPDTTSFRTDTTGGAGAALDTTSMTGTDTSWSRSADTTGYEPSQQQPRDSAR
jgi:hypothetical protein